MDHATPSTKIKEPREKLNATPEDVYSLLGYSWGERRQIITGLLLFYLYFLFYPGGFVLFFFFFP